MNIKSKMKKAATGLGLIAAFIACKPCQSTIVVQGTKENCGGRQLEANTLEEAAFINEEYLYRKQNSKKPFKSAKTDDSGVLRVEHRAKKLEFYRVEKIATPIETGGEACKQWKETPDFTLEAKKKTPEYRVYFHQNCNPCLLQMP